MTRAALHSDIAWLRSNPGLGVQMFDLLNQTAQPPTLGVPHIAMVWDPQRPGWRQTVTLPRNDLRPERGSGHTLRP